MYGSKMMSCCSYLVRNQYTPTNNQRIEAPPTMSPAASPMASLNEVPPTASPAAYHTASLNETPPTTSPVAYFVASSNEELPTASQNWAPTIASNNASVPTYNPTNNNDLVC